jgi:hypothetical protein
MSVPASLVPWAEGQVSDLHRRRHSGNKDAFEECPKRIRHLSLSSPRVAPAAKARRHIRMSERDDPQNRMHTPMTQPSTRSSPRSRAAMSP